MACVFVFSTVTPIRPQPYQVIYAVRLPIKVCGGQLVRRSTDHTKRDPNRDEIRARYNHPINIRNLSARRNSFSCLESC